MQKGCNNIWNLSVGSRSEFQGKWILNTEQMATLKAQPRNGTKTVGDHGVAET